MAAKTVAKRPAKKKVRVPVVLSQDQHGRYLKAAAMLGDMDLAQLFRQAVEEKIRREGLV